MKKAWSLVGVGLIAVSLLGAATVYGRPGFGHGGHRGKHGGPGFAFRVLKSLDLTDAQRTQIEAIMEARRETFAALRSEKHAIRAGIVDTLFAPGEVTTDFGEQAERIAQLEAQLFEERLAVGLEIRKVLTDDQLAEAAAHIQEMRERRAKRKAAPGQNE